MTGSKIEWCQRSDWNAVRGCTRISPGCGGPGPHGGCYAERIAARFSDPGQPFHGFAKRTSSGPRWTGRVEVQWDRLTLPLGWRNPATIFANSTNDWFHEALPIDEIATLYAVAVAAVHLRGHRILILTKRADRMRDVLHDESFWAQVNAEAGAYVMEHTDPLNRRSDDARATCRDDYGPTNPPPGIWLGISVEDQPRADERLPHLRETPAAIRFLSIEPLIGPIGQLDLDGIGWVIVGGESGPNARPMHPDWARSLRDQCQAAGVHFFMKQMTKKASIPIDLMIREFPDAR